MDWLIKLFTREENIAGLEISDSHLRMALLQPAKVVGKTEKKSDVEVKFLAEEPLPKGVVVNGFIQNKAEFIKAARKVTNHSPVKIKFVMVSIPGNSIYSKIFSFPKNIVGEKLKESMDLTLGFQLPDKPEDVYAGWEKVELSTQNEILLTTIQKKPINELVDALDSAGLRVVAVEFHALSICRSMDIKDSETVLIKVPQVSAVSVAIIKNKIPYFVRVLPEQFLASEDMLNKEIDRMVDFFQTDKGPVDRNINISDAKILDKFSTNPEISKNNGKWLVSIGVAMRTLIPRSADNMISLMSIGTEDAYEYQKAVAFSEFILESSIALAIFFVAAFLIVLVSLSSAQQSITKSISSTPGPQLPANADQLQSQAQNINDELVITSGILRTTPDWHMILQKMNADILTGITVNTIGIPSINQQIAISGSASTRDVLNAFNAKLMADPFFSNVVLPITNIDQSTNLPFNITLNITNPQALYYAQ